ncbi:sensor histidine kinase [Anaerocolumna sp. MB42-C2]|uniref:sensor histidine kinase n=1 Tax=Anaerocolumna sp. MB42-C2 TaxID=3070997 RepID=UPI0027DFE89B|nr:HAMP domain-containing sensor histidine kinase [Anaerocolumna sp. MB42-C2]WMJ85658.1 HAMP domain-containing sensor histidine kinase [Anaerocolumna sp. MB42-C2]
MKKKYFLDEHFILTIGLLVFTFYIINVSYMSYTIKNSYSERIISVLGAMSEVYGDMNKSVIDTVVKDDHKAYADGIKLLKKYGYRFSGETLIKDSVNREITYLSVFELTIIIFLFLCLTILFNNHMKFLKRLEGYLDDFNNPGAFLAESNHHTIRIMDKLHKLYINSKHNILLVHQEKAKMHDFMEDLSHQMKTPLTVARLCLERYIYENTGLNTKRLEAGLKQMEKMTVLINSYLKIGMLKSCNTKLEIKDHNVYSFIEECIEDIQPLLDSKNIDITVAGEQEAKFGFDSFWMKEALVNLLKNSIEHSPEDSEITISFICGRHEFALFIKDKGSGIEEQNMPVLFERFVSSIRQKDGSNGLGLAIAKQAVVRHFGQIGVKNNQPCGVTFEIRLPILKGKAAYNNYSDVR